MKLLCFFEKHDWENLYTLKYNLHKGRICNRCDKVQPYGSYSNKFKLKNKIINLLKYFIEELK
jgi:hypothetical protein